MILKCVKPPWSSISKDPGGYTKENGCYLDGGQMAQRVHEIRINRDIVNQTQEEIDPQSSEHGSSKMILWKETLRKETLDNSEAGQVEEVHHGILVCAINGGRINGDAASI